MGGVCKVFRTIGCGAKQSIDMKGGNFYGTSVPKKNQPKMPIIGTKNRFGQNLTSHTVSVAPWRCMDS